jgi:hypothetical protein
MGCSGRRYAMRVSGAHHGRRCYASWRLPSMRPTSSFLPSVVAQGLGPAASEVPPAASSTGSSDEKVHSSVALFGAGAISS